MKHKVNIIARNSFIISFGRGLEFLLGIVSAVLIARYLGVQKFGQYALIRSVGVMIVPLISCGTITILVREIAIDRKKASIYIPSALALHFFSAFVLLAVLTAGLRLFPNVSSEVRQCICLVIIWQLFFAMQRTACSVFVSVERVIYSSLIDMFTRLILVGMYGVVVIADLKMAGLYCAAILAYGIGFAVSCILIKRKGLCVNWRFSKKALHYLLRESHILCVSQLIIQGYMQINVFVLKIFSTVGQIAFYQVPRRVTEPLKILPRSLMFAVLPTLSILGHAQDKKSTLLESYKMIVKYMVVLAFPLCVCITAFAGPMISLLFGHDFMGAAIPLQIYVWTLIPFAINATQTTLLTSSKNQNVLLIGNVCCLVVNGIVSLMLISRYGAIGASVAMACGILSLMLVNFYFIWKCLGRVKIAYYNVGLFFIAALSMCIIIGVLRSSVSAIALIPLAVGVYFCMLFLIGFFSVDEIEILKNLIKKISRKLGLSRNATNVI